MSRVIVLGPVPDSAGGIGVLMGHLSRSTSAGTDLRFVDSGGTPGPPVRRLLRFLKALLVCAGSVPDGTVFHLNLASGLSTWRKLALTTVLRMRGRPYVLHLHGGKFDVFVTRSRTLARRCISSIFRGAAAVVVLGEFWRAEITHSLGVDPARITVVPNAVPGPPAAPLRGTAPIVLFSGQLGRRKGVHDLLEAWTSLPDELRTTLVLAGDNPAPEELGDLLTRTPDVEVTGWLGARELEERLAQASVLVLPSYGENLPMSLLDAMAWGLAPVVTDVGAVGEVVEDGRSAVVVPVGDPPALAEALRSLLSDPERVTRMGREARRRWEEEYRIDNYCERLEDVYERVAGPGT